jgi:hypothetical protein
MQTDSRWVISVLMLAMGAVYSTSGDESKGEGRHVGTRILTAGNLTVEVMDPAAEVPYYQGARFTPVAAVLSAVVGGHEFLDNPIDHNPATEHAGLASEFDLSRPPPGHDEAEAGGGFVKIGVGVLKKKGQNYAFWEPYEIIEPAVTTVTWEESAARYKQVCNGANGYAYELSAVVLLEGDAISIDWTLANTGEKRLSTENYVHNFFRLDDRPVGPGYTVSFPFDYEVTGVTEEQEISGRDLIFKAEIPKWVNIDLTPAEDPAPSSAFTVRQVESGLSIDVVTSVPVSRTTVHATKQHVCPEQFIRLEVEPGKSTSWQRRYVLSAAAR